MADPNTVISTFDDGSIRFLPQSTKVDARYTDDPQRGNFPPGAVCANCAHFIGGGACHVVRGPISPSGSCQRFYADVGVFADAKFEDDPRVSMVLERGEVERWTRDDVNAFLQQLSRQLDRL